MLLKKGRLEINEALGLILGVAVVALLIFFIFQIISPSFDKQEEAAEGYLNSLKESMNNLDEGEISEFSIWEGDYFLIYFNGSKKHFRILGDVDIKGVEEEMYARISEKGINNLCVCYIDSDVDCGECFSLDSGAGLVETVGDLFYGPRIKRESWIHYGKGRLFFKKVDGEYYFSSKLERLNDL